MKTTLKWRFAGMAGVCLLAAVFLPAGNVCAATVDVVADAPAATDPDGTPTFTVGDGFVTVNFAAQLASSMPQYNAITVVASTAGGGSVFAGDYVSAGIRGVTLKLRSELAVQKPAPAMLVLQGRTSGRVWRNESVVVSTTQGLWVVNSVLMDRSSGWTRDGGGDLDAMWLQDLADVEVIGIRFSQPTIQAQSVSIAEFKLFGDGFITDPAVLTPLEQALKDRFGVTSVDALSAQQKAEDVNSNGMRDYIEILSENDLAFANSIFMAEIIEDGNPGILVRWPCVKDWKYTVLRADNLISPFVELTPGTSITATNTGYMTFRDESVLNEGGPYYYRLRKVK